MATKDHKCPTCSGTAAVACQIGNRAVFWQCDNGHRWGNKHWRKIRRQLGSLGRLRAPGTPRLVRTEITLTHQVNLLEETL